MDESKGIVIVSDGTGRTARRLMDAVLAQYSESDIDFSLVKTYKKVLDRDAIDDVMKEIDDEYLVLYSIIERDVSEYFHQELNERGILHLDVLDPMLKTISKFLGVHPRYRPGILHIIDDHYYHKVDAIGYAVEHDDGCGHNQAEADLVLVGPSRTCKTPLSMYLACNHALKIANIPIVAEPMLEDHLLEKLKKVPADRVIGLVMHPEVLSHVRSERMHLLAPTDAGRAKIRSYEEVAAIQDEIRFCRRLYQKHDWHSVDVTRRAIEEISTELLQLADLELEP